MSTTVELTGKRSLELLRDGTVAAAPIQGLLRFDLVEVEDGRVVFASVVAADLCNPMGTVHGGFAMTLLDSACAAAVHTTLAAGEGYTTLETKVNLVRALRPDDGEVRAEGVVVHRGGRVALSEGRLVRSSDGKLVAHATSTCLISAG